MKLVVFLIFTSLTQVYSSNLCWNNYSPGFCQSFINALYPFQPPCPPPCQYPPQQLPPQRPPQQPTTKPPTTTTQPPQPTTTQPPQPSTTQGPPETTTKRCRTPPYNYNCTNCQFPSSCKDVSTIDYSIEQIVNLSPTYFVSVLNVKDRTLWTSACDTFIYAGTGTYLMFRTVVRANGIIRVQKYLAMDVHKYPGRLILIGTPNATTANSAVVSYQYALSESNNCDDLVAFYRCNLYQTCNVNFNLEGYDNVYITSPSTDPCSCSLDEVEADVRSCNAGLNLTSEFFHPSYSPTKCVCSFNGIDVINRDQISGECLTIP